MTVFMHKLDSGRAVQVDAQGNVLCEFDTRGNPNFGILTSQDRRELAQRHEAASEQAAFDRAHATQSDPRRTEVLREIIWRGRPEELERINEDPVLFNRIYGEIRKEVGKSTAELGADIAHADEVSGLRSSLREIGAAQRNTPLEDVGVLIDLTNPKRED